MRVLVVGAAGFLGRSAVLALSAAGVEVRGMIRRPDQVPIVTASGGVPFLGDVGRPEPAQEAAAGCDAILHLASPSGADHSTAAGRAEWDRSRVEGTRNLVRAAREEGVPRLVVGSGYWLFGDHPGVITEESPSQPSDIVSYNWGAEEVGRAAHQSGTLDVVIVRPSMVYGNGAWFRSMVDGIRTGTYRFVGTGSNHWSTVSVADCGEAFRTVIERGRGGDTYLVADDEPVTVRDLTAFVASELGESAPGGIPVERAVRDLGPSVASALSANQAVSNGRLCSLGWRPRHPTYRDGIPSALREILSS
ncbi:MAG: NAD-dependent epimerase/dehydratase family protein [Thermoplasmata archaeon]